MDVNGVRPVLWAKEHCIFAIKAYKKGVSGLNTPPLSFTRTNTQPEKAWHSGNPAVETGDVAGFF